MKKTTQRTVLCSKLVTLKRNPQYLTPEQMESLKASIRRDGFCVPILVKPHTRGRFEIVSGNHRYMAAVELGLKEVLCVVSDTMTADDAKRLAVNLNTIHGEPNAELLAPFLAEMDVALLSQIHLEDDMIERLVEFDATLAASLAAMEPPEKMNRGSRTKSNATCRCQKCGRIHIKE